MLNNICLLNRAVVMEPEKPGHRANQVIEGMHKWKRKNQAKDLGC